MLRIVPSMAAEGAKRYFDDALSRGDYYLEGQELAGNWGGRAAEQLGLVGEITQQAFHQLCDNVDPTTGKRLTARNRAGRRVGYDFNFHCPKKVSVVHALTQDDRIMAAFRVSVTETMQELEADTQVRVRDNGQNSSRTSGNMLWGEFIHTTARPVSGVPDPHLHAHCFAFNASWDPEQKKWKAADFGNIKRDARYYEAAFHARFSRRMANMGYGVQRDGKGFWDIASVPDSVREKFSRRSQEIGDLANELGIVDPDSVAELGAKSREAKSKGVSNGELTRVWDIRLTGEERDAIHSASGSWESGSYTTVSEAMQYAESHLLERKSVVSERELVEAGLRHSFGSVAVEKMWSLKNDQESKGYLLGGDIDGRKMVTTRRALAEERAMLNFAKEGRGRCQSLGSAEYEFKDALFGDLRADTAEQEAAIRAVLRSHDRVITIRGAAGTGKTTLMREVVAAINEGGRRVFGFAPSADASRGVMREEGFAGADTVTQLLISRELQDEVQGQVIWIDEAGTIGVEDLRRVFDLAERRNCRVILTGDTRQHTPVARGDALRVLEKEAGLPTISITKIQRQRVHGKTEPDDIKRYRRAVKLLSEGDAVRGFKALDKMKTITEIDSYLSADEKCRLIAADYLAALDGKNTKGKDNRVLVVSPTHAECNAVTAHIREGLKAAGKIGKMERELTRLINTNWTEAERRDFAMYRPGQVIQFHQNVKGGITRGDRFKVKEVQDGRVMLEKEAGDKSVLPLGAASKFSVYEQVKLNIGKGDKVRITQNGFTSDRKHRLDNGAIYSVKTIRRNGKIVLENDWEINSNFGHIAHGYVTTSHASQGKTVDVVLIAQSSQSFAASSLEQFYVSVSRGKERVKIYTDDKEALEQAVKRSGQRVSATELARETDIGKEAASKPPIFSSSHGKSKEAIAGDRNLKRRRYDQVIARAMKTLRGATHERGIERD